MLTKYAQVLRIMKTIFYHPLLFLNRMRQINIHFCPFASCTWTGIQEAGCSLAPHPCPTLRRECDGWWKVGRDWGVPPPLLATLPTLSLRLSRRSRWGACAFLSMIQPTCCSTGGLVEWRVLRFLTTRLLSSGATGNTGSLVTGQKRAASRPRRELPPRDTPVRLATSSPSSVSAGCSSAAATPLTSSVPTCEENKKNLILT